MDLLTQGELLVVFPEGRPVIDPEGSREPTLLPFASGFASLALSAGVAVGHPIPVLPVGLAYEPAPGRGTWSVRLRLGEAMFLRDRAGRSAFVEQVRNQVSALSKPG
jgi:putative membrane protein